MLPRRDKRRRRRQTRKDSATQLLICVQLSLAISGVCFRMAEATNSKEVEVQIARRRLKAGELTFVQISGPENPTFQNNRFRWRCTYQTDLIILNRKTLTQVQVWHDKPKQKFSIKFQVSKPPGFKFQKKPGYRFQKMKQNRSPLRIFFLIGSWDKFVG